MNIKSQKGITGVDVSVAIIIILLFMGLISTLIYNYIQNANEIKRKSTATYIIIDLLEYAKGLDYSDLTEENITQYKNDKFSDYQYKGYKVETKLEDCTELFGENSEDALKKVTVTVSYTVKKNEKKLEIYTVVENDQYGQLEKQTAPILIVDD